MNTNPGIDVVIVPPTHDLGDGFHVRRALPSRQRRMVGPFVFFDQMGPTVLRAGSGLPIVVVIGPAQPAALVRLVESGACGILGREEATADRLVRAIQLAAAGQGDLPPALVRHLLDRVGQLNRETRRSLPRPGRLTGREREVLRLLADGMSTREVAARLAYPERTVTGVVQDLMLRLNVRNRAQAVASAVRNGWV